MILRRYGTKYQSVTPNFDSRAMTEIGFRRDEAMSLSVEEFDAKYERAAGRELAPTAAGDVQGEVEEALLHELGELLSRLEQGLEAGQILVIENQPGVDNPKTRGKQSTTVVEAENRLKFEFVVDPPLRIGIFQPR